ncbi:MAG: type II toxin-antitoxin system MqsR family toxin [Rhodobacteraceae bacterium]|nr:type II toxin-antitoxin system MqsR family toxin [Paracoccaceae bacterium]
MSVTEKRKPTHDLKSIKTIFSSVKDLKATGSALKGAASLGFESHDIVEVIQSMEHHHFRKSMTSYADHRVWQDVYHVPSGQRTLYVKFTSDDVTEFLLLSFKEEGDG